MCFDSSFKDRISLLNDSFMLDMQKALRGEGFLKTSKELILLCEWGSFSIIQNELQRKFQRFCLNVSMHFTCKIPCQIRLKSINNCTLHSQRRIGSLKVYKCPLPYFYFLEIATQNFFSYLYHYWVFNFFFKSMIIEEEHMCHITNPTVYKNLIVNFKFFF